MIDWVQVLLGQPLEEEQEESVEELSRMAEWSAERKRKEEADEAALTLETDAAEGTVRFWAEAAEDREARTEMKMASASELEWAEAQSSRTEWERMAQQSVQGAKAEEGDGAERVRDGLQSELGFSGLLGQTSDSDMGQSLEQRGEKTTTESEVEQAKAAAEAADRSAGAWSAALSRDEALVWRRSGVETLAAESAKGRAEQAAAQTMARGQGSASAYLEAALSPAAPTAPTAGRLLVQLARNDQAAAYQTMAQRTEQAESQSWTGTDPLQLDRVFERDARRYDNGFALY